MYSRPATSKTRRALAARDHEIQLGRQNEQAGAAAGEIAARQGQEFGLSSSVHGAPFGLMVDGRRIVYPLAGMPAPRRPDVVKYPHPL